MQRCTSSASEFVVYDGELQFYFFLQLRFFFHIGFGLCFPHRKDLPLDITALAQEVFDILRAPANPVPCTPESHRRKKSQFFINSSSKKAKSVTLHIQGLDSTVSGWGCSRYSSAHVLQINQGCSFFSRQDQRSLCEEALLKVRGVISFTFQMASKRCTVRIRSDLPTEVVLHSLIDLYTHQELELLL